MSEKIYIFKKFERFWHWSQAGLIMFLMLTAFDIHDDGTLANRRTWAPLDARPDGIALDAEGAIWLADPVGRRIAQV